MASQSTAQARESARQEKNVWKKRAQAADRVIASVRQVHRLNPLADLPADDPNRTYYNAEPICLECVEDYPCTTVRLLDMADAN